MRDDEALTARRARALVNPFVVEIADALFELGGEAHRDRVLGLAAERRGWASVGPDLSHELIEAFDLHMAQAERQGAPALFALPSGRDGKGWALTEPARRLLSARGPA